jgi:hypothetical protein
LAGNFYLTVYAMNYRWHLLLIDLLNAAVFCTTVSDVWLPFVAEANAL